MLAIQFVFVKICTGAIITTMLATRNFSSKMSGLGNKNGQGLAKNRNLN